MYFCAKVMYFVFYVFVSFFHFRFFIFLPYLRKFVLFSIYEVYNFQECKENVGTGISTLMSIADGLGPSISCRKMEKARPLKEEMDRNVIYFPPESALPTLKR